MRIFFELRDFQTTYDIHYDLEDYKADGAVMIKFVAASYEIEIIRPHGSTATESTIKYIGTKGNQKFMEVLVDPENEYTQIVAHEVCYFGLKLYKRTFFYIVSFRFRSRVRKFSEIQWTIHSESGEQFLNQHLTKLLDRHHFQRSIIMKIKQCFY